MQKITELGKVLRTLRVRKNESQKEMSQNLDITQAYLSAIELGKRNPTQEFIRLLIHVYAIEGLEKENLMKAIALSVPNVDFDLDGASAIKKTTLYSMYTNQEILTDDVMMDIYRVLKDNNLAI